TSGAATISNGTLGGSTPAVAGGVPVWVEGPDFVSVPRPAGANGIKLTGLLPGTTAAQAGDYISLGAAPLLGVKTFTLEAWIRRSAAGTATSSGSGGLTAVPLITKGMAETDAIDNKDMNYFFGINQANGRLAADFEDTTTTVNHPAFGAATIAPDNAWHHVAVTYDINSVTGAGTYQFYLDGVADGAPTAVTGNSTPRFDSIQWAAIGSALQSNGSVTGQTQGYFAGTMDEVRIWNYARSASQIFSGRDREILSASGLLGRWGFSECGQALDSTGHVNGTLMGSGWTCVAGSAMPGTVNAAPAVNAGTDFAITLPTAALLSGSVIDDGVAAPLTYAWVQTSGPGVVTFANAAAQSTSATFSAPGGYDLTLTVSDGELSGSDSVHVAVSAPANNAPAVDAGSDDSITLPINSVTLHGAVSDDGLPGGGVTTQWSKISGPGAVTFGNAAAPSTTATFV